MEERAKERLLVIGYKEPSEQEIKRVYLREGLYPYYAENIRNAIEELDSESAYSLVLVFDGVNVVEAVRKVRHISNVPILVIKEKI